MLLEALWHLKKERLKSIQNSFEDFSYKCSQATRDSHLFYTAVNNNWLDAAAKIRTRVCRNLSDFSYQLHRFKDIAGSEESKMPNLADIFAELKQIDLDLGEFQYDLKQKSISIVTDPITLEGIAFGPFEIRLLIDEIPRIYGDSPYRVIALDPNPAGTDSCVTHPHVSSERLCEGDGHISIRKAIEQGRFCDYFTIIVNILQTYNPDSPYVSLDDWEGISCYDCGYTISGDECYYCEYCDRDYCSHCSSYCQMCDTTICLGCAYECPSCNEPVCRECTAQCIECEDTFCKDCLTAEGLCPNCEEQRKEDSNEENETEIPETNTAFQSNCMGQATFHA